MAAEQRKLLIFIPLIILFLCMCLFVYVGYSGFVAVTGQNMGAAEFMVEYTFLIQFAIGLLCTAIVAMLAALQPTFVRGIAYVAYGLNIYFREQRLALSSLPPSRAMRRA